MSPSLVPDEASDPAEQRDSRPRRKERSPDAAIPIRLPNRSPWPAMGVGLRNGLAAVWFGSTSDSQGTIGTCVTTPAAQSTWGAIKVMYR